MKKLNQRLLYPFCLAAACVVMLASSVNGQCLSCGRTASRPSCDCAAPIVSGGNGTGETPQTLPPEAPDAANLPDISDLTSLDQSLDTGFGYDSAAPNLIGDFFGGSTQRLILRNVVPFAVHAHGFIESSGNGPGGSTSVLVFETIRDGSNGSIIANDFRSVGPGIDVTGDRLADTFRITEPVPPSDAPVSPGSTYVFDGGTAVLTHSTEVTTPQDGAFDDGSIWFAEYSFSETVIIDVPAGGSSVRRMKLSENNSPVPRDRLYGLYSFFSDVPNGYQDVNRYSVGVERTFWDGGMSIDVRFPFAATLSSDQIAEGIGSRDAEFGNTTVAWKALLWEDSTLLTSTGLGVALPTADETRVLRSDGRQLMRIENEAVHLLPYAAFLWTPNERTFYQGFAQVDFDVNGNGVNADVTSANIRPIGQLQDATLLFLDFTTGFWAHRNPYAAVITGLAPVVELHYSTTLQDADSVAGNGLTVDNTSRRLDVLNATVGTHIFLGDRLTVTPGFAFPLRDGNDQQFDFEGIVQANWYF